MRAFIAIDLPDTLREKLAEVQRTLGGGAPDARWSRPTGLHLTLKFLGEISQAQTEQVTQSLAAIGKIEPIAIEVRGFGFFPNPRRPRIFWSGVEAQPSPGELASKIDRALQRLGFPKEDRAFSPHLTLARFSAPRPQPVLEKALAHLGSESLGSFQASEFFLFESKLSPQGSIYRKVVRFPR